MNTKKQIYEWKHDLEIKKECVKDITSALSFSKNSKIDAKDLVKVLQKIKGSPKKQTSMPRLYNTLNYEKKQLNSIVTRLMKLGEIYNPYFTGKKHSDIIKII